MENKNAVKPIIIKDPDHGQTYTLEFSRDTVRFAEGRGFDISDVAKFPMSKIPELFYYAFRMHHKNLSRSQTDAILFDGLGGVPEGLMERLGQLYAAPFDTLMLDEGEAKNGTMTVEL